MKFLFLFPFAFAIVGLAQINQGTRVKPEQLIGPVSPTGYALVILPNGQVSIAVLENLALDTTGGRAILRAAPPTARVRTIVAKPTLSTKAFDLVDPPLAPTADTLDVWWNGIMLSEGEDYTIEGLKITLIATVSPGDVVKIRYRY